MAAGDRLISIFNGTIHRVRHYILTEDIIENLPFLRIMSNVYRFCPQLYPKIVHQLESLHECSVPGHDLIEIVTMRD